MEAELVKEDSDKETDDDTGIDKATLATKPYTGMTVHCSSFAGSYGSPEYYLTCAASHHLHGCPFLGHAPAARAISATFWKVEDESFQQFLDGGAMWEWIRKNNKQLKGKTQVLGLWPPRLIKTKHKKHHPFFVVITAFYSVKNEHQFTNYLPHPNRIQRQIICVKSVWLLIMSIALSAISSLSLAGSKLFTVDCVVCHLLVKLCISITMTLVVIS